MSGLNGRPIEMAPQLAHDGETPSLSDVFNRSFEQWRLNEGRAQFNGLAEELYDREIQRIKDMGGPEYVNPFRYTKREMMRGNAEGLTGSSFDRFEQLRQRFAEGRKDIAHEINPGRHTLSELYERQRKVEKASEEAVEASPYSVNVWLLGQINPAALAGGLVGSFTDPFGLAQNLIGPGGKAAQGAKAVLWKGAQAGAVNAGVTGTMQPFVQDWRRQAGLEYGFDHAAQAMAGAALVGFGLDAGVRGGIRGVQRFRGREAVLDADGKVAGWRLPEAAKGQAPAVPGDPAVAPPDASPDAGAPARVPANDVAPPTPRIADPIEALDAAAERLPADHPVAKAAAGDDEALLQVARDSDALTDPAVRGAAQELERYRLFGPPPEVDPLEHYVRLAEAIQRTADPEAPPPGIDLPAAAAVDVAKLSPELADARQRLIDQVGSPLDMAALIRMAPELVDGSLHLSDHKTKQARLLARLSDEAFEMVTRGEVSPNHAVVVARHVADEGQHARVLQEVSRAGLRSEAQVRMLIGELTSRAGSPDVHAARTGAHDGLRILAAERAKVLDSGMKALLREPRVAAVLEAEAARLEAALPEAMRGNKKLVGELGKKVAGLVEALARETGSVVANMVQDAALAIESGAGIRVTSRALAARIADVVEQGGLDGLARMAEVKAEKLEARGFSDPVGSEAKAQMEVLANQVKLSLPDDGGSRGRRATGGLAAARRNPSEGAGEGAARDGGSAAGREPGAGAGAGRRRDAGEDGRPVGKVGNFGFDSGFVGTVIATRTGDGGLNRRQYWIHKEGASLPSEKASAKTVEHMLRQMGNWVARIDIIEGRPGVWEVGMVNVDPRNQRQHIAARLYAAIEADVGGVIEPSGKLMRSGYAFWQWRNANLVQHHRYSDLFDMYVSPKELIFHLGLTDKLIAKARAGGALRDLLGERAHLVDLLDTIPAEAKTPEYLANSFSLRDPVEPKGQAAADWQAIRAEVDEALRLLPKDVRTRVDSRIVYGGRDVDGMWDATERLVRVALNERAPVTARHEVMHALKDMGLVTDAEWLVMAGRARALYDDMNVEGRWRQQLEEAYPNDPHRVDAALLEEAVAEMFGRWKGGARYGSAIDRVFKTIHELIERVGNALRGRGFLSADDVFRRVERGEVSLRDTLDRTSELTKFSLKKLKHDASFDHLAEWLGIDPHRIVIDAVHIAAKRRKKSQEIDASDPNLPSNKLLRLEAQRERGVNTAVDQQLSHQAGVRDFVREVLSDAWMAKRYKVGSSWNVVLPREDGTWWQVSIDRIPNEKGEHLVRTAYVMTASEAQRGLAGAVSDHGIAGLKWKGDPAGLESLLAHVSEAQRAAPGRIPDSVTDMLRQHLETARRMKAELRDEKLRAGFERWSNDQLSAEAERVRQADPNAVEAQRIKDAGDFASVCKS